MFFQAPEGSGGAELDDAADTLIGRRSAPRLSVRLPAVFRLGEGSADVIVLDISATGARLHAPCPPPKGRDGVLSWQEVECPCRVAWSAKDSFGVSFHDAARAFHDLAALAKSSREERPAPVVSTSGLDSQPWATEPPPPRRPAIERPAEVRQGDAWIKVVLRGISQHGFEVGWFPRCKEQAPISLRGPGLPLLHGRVVASDHLVVRCKLRAPLHDAVLQHISAQIGIGG